MGKAQTYGLSRNTLDNPYLSKKPISNFPLENNPIEHNFHIRGHQVAALTYKCSYFADFASKPPVVTWQNN